MRAVVRFVFLNALRDRLFSGLIGMILLTFAVSLFLGSAAVIEQSEAGRVYAAGTTRFVLILGMAIFIAFQTQRLFESREIEAMLSRALSRTTFVVAYWLGYAFVAVALVVLIFLLLFALYKQPSVTAIWSLSLLLECLAVMAFTQLAALTLERATTTIFVTVAFYAFTRLLGFFLGIRYATPDTGANSIVNPMLDGLGLLLPRLDLMTQTEWLVYGFDVMQYVPIVLGQVICFIALALVASAFDLNRKQF